MILVLNFTIPYSIYKICVSFKDLEKPEMREELENLIDGSNMKSLLSSLVQISFLVRKLISAFVLVCLGSFPYFQIIALSTLSLVHLTYIAAVRPHDSFHTNAIECFDELSIMICNYLMYLFMLSDDLSLSNKLSWTFIAFNVLNIAVHVTIIGYGTYL